MQIQKEKLDLNFNGHNTLYATHGLHSYAAKCPPQLVEFGIKKYSNPGEIVLDPMAGSGTSLVEARILGRSGIGYDIDPLACLIARVKSHCVEDEQISDAYGLLRDRVLVSWEDYQICGELPDEIGAFIPSNFPNMDYWFAPKVQMQLTILSYHLSSLPIEEDIREFLWVAFSAIILTKVSVANARDIIHSRHHFFQHEETPDVFEKFDQRVKTMRRRMIDYNKLCQPNSDVEIEIKNGDARCLSLEDESVDFIFTSPPYATALDYPRAHFLAIGWMEPLFGVEVPTYRKHGATYVGSERGRIEENPLRSEKLLQFDLAQSAIEDIAEDDLRRAKLIHRYFVDMFKMFGEMNRVLKVNRHVVMVVCPSHIRKVEVPTHKVFHEMAHTFDLQLEHEYTRTINAQRRVLPYIRKSFGKRMSTEYVLVYKKKGG